MKQDVDAFVDELKTAIPKAFESEEYTKHRDKVMQELETGRRQIIVQVEQRTTQAGFQLLKSPGGLLLVPAVDGKPISDEDLAQLKPEEQGRIAEAATACSVSSKSGCGWSENWKKALATHSVPWTWKLRPMPRATFSKTCARAIATSPAVLDHLEAMQADITAHADDFRKGKESEPAPSPLAALVPGADKFLVRNQINVLVNNRQLKGAPVIVETNPTYHNLTGRIEHQATWAGVVTDHTMIKPGALHRARGGHSGS